jgi:cell division protein ZapA
VKKKVEVALLGRSFTVKSDKDEAYLHQVANFVNRKFEEMRPQARAASTYDLALLVALNLADELFEAEERAKSSRSEVRKRSERLLENLDAALAEMGTAETEAEPVPSATEAVAR